jgi:hypothetical protein
VGKMRNERKFMNIIKNKRGRIIKMGEKNE